MDGVKLPYQQKITENEWGMSIVERIFDRLTSYDSTSVGAAQLAYKAHLRTAKIKKLREIIATGGKAFEALIKNMEMVRQYQTCLLYTSFCCCRPHRRHVFLWRDNSENDLRRAH